MVWRLFDDITAGADGAKVQWSLLSPTLAADGAITFSTPDANGQVTIGTSESFLQALVAAMVTDNTEFTFNSQTGIITFDGGTLTVAEFVATAIQLNTTQRGQVREALDLPLSIVAPANTLPAASTAVQGTIQNEAGVFYVDDPDRGGNEVHFSLGHLAADSSVQGRDPGATPPYGNAVGSEDQAFAIWKTSSGFLPGTASAYTFVTYIPRSVQATRPASVYLTFHNGATGEFAESASMAAATALDTATYWAFGASDLSLESAADGNPITIAYFTDVGHNTPLNVRESDSWDPLLPPLVFNDTIDGTGTHADPYRVAIAFTAALRTKLNALSINTIDFFRVLSNNISLEWTDSNGASQNLTVPISDILTNGSIDAAKLDSALAARIPPATGTTGYVLTKTATGSDWQATQAGASPVGNARGALLATATVTAGTGTITGGELTSVTWTRDGNAPARFQLESTHKLRDDMYGAGNVANPLWGDSVLGFWFVPMIGATERQGFPVFLEETTTRRLYFDDGVYLEFQSDEVSGQHAYEYRFTSQSGSISSAAGIRVYELVVRGAQGEASPPGNMTDVDVEDTTADSATTTNTEEIPAVTVNLTNPTLGAGEGITIADDAITFANAGLYHINWSVEGILAASSGSTTRDTSNDGGKRLYAYTWLELQEGGVGNWSEITASRSSTGYSKTERAQGPSRAYTGRSYALLAGAGDKVRLRFGGYHGQMQFSTVIARTNSVEIHPAGGGGGTGGAVGGGTGGAVGGQSGASGIRVPQQIIILRWASTRPTPTGGTFTDAGLVGVPTGWYTPGFVPGAGASGESLWAARTTATYNTTSQSWALVAWDDAFIVDDFSTQFSTSAAGTSPHYLPTAADTHYRVRDASTGTWSAWLALYPDSSWVRLVDVSMYQTLQTAQAITLPSTMRFSELHELAFSVEVHDSANNFVWGASTIVPIEDELVAAAVSAVAYEPGASWRVMWLKDGLPRVLRTPNLWNAPSGSSDYGGFHFTFRRPTGSTDTDEIGSIVIYRRTVLNQHGRIRISVR